jgi:hypothetical protein
VIALIDMALYRDLAGNTDFAPLLKAAFEAAARRSINQAGSSYSRKDTLIGFHPASTPKPVTTFEAYVWISDGGRGAFMTRISRIITTGGERDWTGRGAGRRRNPRQTPRATVHT